MEQKTVEYIPIDSKNREHIRATTNFLLSNNVHILMDGKDLDVDRDYRKFLAKKLGLNLSSVIEESNGSLHSLLERENGYEDSLLLFEFYAGDFKNDFAVEVLGRMRYNPSSKRVVFIPNNETIKRVRVTEIY